MDNTRNLERDEKPPFTRLMRSLGLDVLDHDLFGMGCCAQGSKRLF